MFFRDVQQLTTIGLRILMYVSPVIYGLSLVPDAYRGWYLLNPIACLFALFQWCLLGGEAPPMWTVGVMAAVLGTFIVIAHLVYSRQAPRITKHF